MTVTVEPPTDRRPRPSRRTTLVVLGVGGALVLAGALVLGLRWWTHPDLVPDHRDGMSMDPSPVAQAARSAAVTFPDSSGHPATLTFHSAHAVLANDSARSQTSFAICRTRPGADPVGFGSGDLSAYCSSVRPLTDGTRMAYPNPREYVVVVITPTRPGRTHLVGVDLDYSLGAPHLFRHGTDEVAMNMHVTAR